MSRKERSRLTVLANVKKNDLSLREAAQLLALSYRQVKRLWRRYKDQGDEGLVHRLRGRASSRGAAPELKAKILARVEQKYPDFGPTLASEYLAREGMKVDHETLRRWLLAKGSRTVRRRRQRHRQWRERKPCFGAMVQLDGSDHDWFEGRRDRAVLMVMVDDATGRVWAQFFEQETTRASYDMLEGWAKRYGLPQSVYVDRDSIYRCEGVGSIADQLAGKEPQTQFGRAMQTLGVELILANSPQAKGRVERMNGTLQDRLVKALRLEGIKDLEAANKYVAKTFLPAFNRRFMVEPASRADVHGTVPRNLEEVLSWEESRVVQRDWTASCEKRIYQLDRQHEPMSLAGRKIIVRRLRNGQVQLVYRGTKLRWKELPQRPQRVPVKETKPKTKAESKPAAEHPWRRSGIAAGRAFWRTVKARGKATRQPLDVGPSGRPSLRSGRPACPTSKGKNKETHPKQRGHFLVS